jgi:hypothetical protein
MQVAFLQNIAGTDHPACRIDCSSTPAFGKPSLATDAEIPEIESISDEIELAKSMLS